MQRTARVRQGPKAEVISRSVGLANWSLAITLPGFLINAAVGAASGLIIGEDRCALSGGSKCTEERYVQATSNPVSAVNHL